MRTTFSATDYAVMFSSSLLLSFLTITLRAKRTAIFPYQELLVPSLALLGAVTWFISSSVHRPRSTARRYCILFGFYLVLLSVPKFLLFFRVFQKLLPLMVALETVSFAPLIFGMMLMLSTRFALMDWKKVSFLLITITAFLLLLFNAIIAGTAPPRREASIFDIPSLLLFHIVLSVLCLTVSTVGVLTLPKGLLKGVITVFQVVGLTTVVLDVSIWFRRMEIPVITNRFLVSTMKLFYPTLSSLLPIFYYNKLGKIVTAAS